MSKEHLALDNLQCHNLTKPNPVNYHKHFQLRLAFGKLINTEISTK